MPQTDSYLESLTARPSAVFDTALKYLTHDLSLADSSGRLSILRQAFAKLTGESTLPLRERDRRIRLFLERARLNDTEVIGLADLFNVKGTSLANVLLSALSPESKQLLLKATESPSTTPTEVSHLQREQEVTASGQPSADKFWTSSFRAVVLLGTELEHARNTSLLKEHSFTPLPLRQNVEGSLEKLLFSDVCGLVIAGSFWEGKNSSEQEYQLRLICSTTSILFLRIDEGNLHPDAAAFLAKIQEGALGVVRRGEFCRGNGCDITRSDIYILSRIAQFLNTSESVSVVSDELDDLEAKLLRAAAASYIKGGHLGDRAISKLSLRFLHGGLSGAKVAIIKPDDGGSSLVAKIHDMASLQEEVKRHQEYIVRWEVQVRPTLHFHFGKSLLLYNLVDNPGAPGSPAPTLDERLDKLLLSEIGWKDDCPDEKNLSLAIERASKKLMNLNKQASCRTKAGGSEWLTKGINSLGSRGITWRSSTAMNCSDLTADASTWLEQAKKLDGWATCHGDVHLKNILVSDDLAPVFIDYCLSGPGHPCYDLVRLGAAILYKVFRTVDDEEVISRLLRNIIIDGFSFSDIERLYPHITQSTANKVSLKATIVTRVACLEVLDLYKGGLPDYLSMQGLVACQALTMNSLQTGTVRAMLRALR